MYDSLNFWLNRVEAGSNFEASAQYLAGAKETVNRETGEIWTVGNLDNLKVTVSMSGVSVKGSLAKFHLPDNIYTLNRNQVKDAICNLSDTLHLDLLQANVIRIDASTNFMMQHETGRYFEVLGLCTHFNRIQTAESTLSYHSRGKEQKRSMVFYDKMEESKKRGIEIPDVYAGSNLLRYESRWNTRLPQQFKEPMIKGFTLFDRAFYNKVISQWANNYFMIEKKNTIKADALDKVKTVSDAVDLIFATALQRIPANEIQGILEELKNRNAFSDRIYYTRLKNKLKDITSKAVISETDDLVKELDGEVRQILAYKR